MPWATHARQCCIQWVATPKGEANLIICSLVQIEGCNSPSDAGIRSNRSSSENGEYHCSLHTEINVSATKLVGENPNI